MGNAGCYHCFIATHTLLLVRGQLKTPRWARSGVGLIVANPFVTNRPLSRIDPFIMLRTWWIFWPKYQQHNVQNAQASKHLLQFVNDIVRSEEINITQERHADGDKHKAYFQAQVKRTCDKIQKRGIVKCYRLLQWNGRQHLQRNHFLDKNIVRYRQATVEKKRFGNAKRSCTRSNTEHRA